MNCGNGIVKVAIRTDILLLLLDIQSDNIALVDFFNDRSLGLTPPLPGAPGMLLGLPPTGRSTRHVTSTVHPLHGRLDQLLEFLAPVIKLVGLSHLIVVKRADRV